MDKILNAFQNLFDGEDVKKQHFFASLLFLLPCIAATTVQMIDKESKTNLVPMLIAVLVLFVLSIIPMLMLQGLWYKFLNRRFNEPYGIPQISWDCLIQGIKGLPVAITWGLYISIPCFIYLAVVIGGFAYSLAEFQKNIPALIISGIIFCILLLLLVIPMFIISPFLAMVYMKYSENFEYSKELFNPLLIFKFMKKEFKQSIFTALKFVVVNFVTNIAAQLIVLIGAIIGFILFFVIGAIVIFAGGNENFINQWYFLVPAILYGSIFTTISAYIHWLTQLAYADCLEEIYVEKILELN